MSADTPASGAPFYPAAEQRPGGLTPADLLERGLCVIEGKGITGQLVYERPAYVFDPRRIKKVRITRKRAPIRRRPLREGGESQAEAGSVVHTEGEKGADI